MKEDYPTVRRTKSTNKIIVGGKESWTTAKDTSVPNAEIYETEVGWVEMVLSACDVARVDRQLRELPYFRVIFWG